MSDVLQGSILGPEPFNIVSHYIYGRIEYTSGSTKFVVQITLKWEEISPRRTLTSFRGRPLQTM